MTTPAQHLVEADALLRQALDDKSGSTHFQRNLWLAAAQVHATLALAGINALTVTSAHFGDSQDLTDLARIVQPKALERNPCGGDYGCADIRGDGCLPRCLEARKANPLPDMECPF